MTPRAPHLTAMCCIGLAMAGSALLALTTSARAETAQQSYGELTMQMICGSVLQETFVDSQGGVALVRSHNGEVFAVQQFTPDEAAYLWSGDFDGDEVIDDDDVLLLSDCLGYSAQDEGYVGTADLNLDGAVDMDDTDILLDRMGQTAQYTGGVFSGCGSCCQGCLVHPPGSSERAACEQVCAGQFPGCNCNGP